MKETFFFVHPDHPSAHTDMMLNLTKVSYEKSTGRDWSNVNNTSKKEAKKWIKEIKSMSIVEQSYVFFYIIENLYPLCETPTPFNFQKFLAKKEFNTARCIIWECCQYGIDSKIESFKPYDYNDEVVIVDIDVLEGEKIDEFIANYKKERE